MLSIKYNLRNMLSDCWGHRTLYLCDDDFVVISSDSDYTKTYFVL
jgi:hypothetical protein